MNTDDLIVRLSETVAPVGRSAVARTLALGVGGGALVSIAIMVPWLGIRPDLSVAATTAPYWIKFFYTALLATAAFWLMTRLARPGVDGGMAARLIALPFAVMLAFGAAQLALAPADEWRHLVMGASADVCPWRIIALSLPVFAGTFLSLRTLAPTRLVAAGAVAGLLAGAAGAWVYAFHCDESAAPFVAIWYSIGITAMGATGAAIGRFALRW